MISEKLNLSPEKRFEHLLSVISSDRFREKKGLGNEVPFFICPYPSQDSVKMEKVITQLYKSLLQKGVEVLNINLYDLVIELLQKRGIWEQILQLESTLPSKSQLLELFQSVLDPETHLIPAITEKMKDVAFDVMFISGVGEVFPYIRSHNVLNNLQSKAKEQPTVMFFPGVYTHSLSLGASLDLFGRLHDDKYYRAFNIFHYEAD
jgi:Domain of unknown function (DUF1788)